MQVGDFVTRHHSGDHRASEAPLHDGFARVIELSHIENNWFIPKYVNHALGQISAYLTRKELTRFSDGISIRDPRTVAVICAGNIPAVGWHDIMCVLLTGHRVLIKLSSDDRVLIPFLLKLLTHYEPRFESQVFFASGKLSAFDAVIATGSNNTAMHFRYYFGKYPHIIRHNRTSVAVLDGKEKPENLKKLGADIFTYFGLGCRNVSKLLVPESYSFDPFFECIVEYGDVVNNKKYGNNYDYHRAIYLLNQEKFLDNNFLILKESREMHAPVSVLFYQRYKDPGEVAEYLQVNETELQCVVGKGHLPFGYSQRPVITEFADKTNTLAFLVNL